MEDFSIRAIFIGVSLFITMAVVSAIIIYYNTARSMADAISNRVDIADTYDKIMNDEKDDDVLTGVEVRSLINKYAGDDKVQINILSINGQDLRSDDEYKNINNTWYKEVNDKDVKLISEAKLDLINPSCKCKTTKVHTVEKIELNLELI